MQQSPSWEANQFSASQVISRVLWIPQIHCQIYKYPPPVPIQSHLDPVYTPTSHFQKIHLILSSHLRLDLPIGLSRRFPHQNPVYAFPLTHNRYMPSPSHSSRFYHPHNIGWEVQNVKLFFMKFSPIPCYLIPLMPKYSLFSNNKTYFPPSKWATKFHTHTKQQSEL